LGFSVAVCYIYASFVSVSQVIGSEAGCFAPIWEDCLWYDL